MSISLSEAPDQTLTLADANAPPIPTSEGVAARAARTHYALGDQSPGLPVLTQSISSGQEPDLRQTVAGQEKQRLVEAKNQLVSQTIQNEGDKLTPAGAQAVMDVHNTDPQVDPDTSLEKVFADKYTQDILGIAPLHVLDHPAVQAALPEEAETLAGMQMIRQFYQTQLENLQGERDREGWGTWAKNFVVGMVPFLPWWKQAGALDRPSDMNFLPGSTIRDNVQWLYSNPLSRQKELFKQAMDHFDRVGNIEDKIMFTSALLSFSTTDRYLANAMGLADYGTIAAPVAKGLGKLLAGGAKKAAEETAAEAAETLAKPITVGTDKDAALRTSTAPAEEQLDLFGPRPAQPDLFETANGVRTQGTPTLESKLPPGQMRGQHETQFDLFGNPPDQYSLPSNTGRPLNENRTVEGRIVPSGRVSSTDYKQGNLPLEQAAEHQSSFDFSFRPPPKATSGPTSETSIKVNGVERPDLHPKVEQLRHAFADAQKATEGMSVPKVDVVLSAMGDTESGGFISALKRMMNPFGEGNDEVASRLLSTYNPRGFLEDSKVIGNSRAAQLEPLLKREFDKLTIKTADLARVVRLNPQALAIAKKNAEDALLRQYGNSHNAAILDQKFGFISAEAHPANVPTVTLKLGKPGGVLFDTEEEARLWASERYNLPGAVVEQQGFKYHLSVPQPLDETAPDVLRATITDQNTFNKSFMTSLLGRLRTASDLVGNFQNEQRQIAVHAQEGIKALIKKEIQTNIASLKTKERQALSKMLVISRDSANERTGDRGFWWQTAGQYEQAFLERNRRLPTEKEVLAYQKYRQLQDWEYLVENAAVYRDKARKGIQQHRFALGDGSYSPWFEGKRLDGVPWQEGGEKYEAGIWLHDQTTGKGKFYYQFQLSKDQKDMINKLVEDGAHVIKVADPRSHPLEDIAKTAAGQGLKEQVNYVITKGWDTKSLSWNQVKYREGPHSIYRHNYYIAQPQIQAGRNGKMTYFGDNNILNVETEAQAKKWSAIIDRGRLMLRDGRHEELAKYLRDNLPLEWNTLEKFSSLFTRKDSPLDLKLPVVFKQANHNTIDTVGSLKQDFPNLIDGLKNPHDMTNDMDKALLLERDNVLSTIREGATAHIAPAEQFDPYVALNKALNQRIRNLWMNDYKHQAVQSWIQDFKNVLDPNSKTLEAFPLKFLYEPQWANTGGSLSAERQAAEAARLAIVNFIGTKSELGKNLDWVKTKLLNSIYSKIGQGTILDTALATTSDPVHFLRGIAFHTKLGLFNPVQLMVQAQTMAVAVAVAGPKHGFSGLAVAPLLRALGHNPTQLDAIAKVASKFGWSSSDFKEMWSAMEKTGLWEVAGEAAMRDNAYDPKLFQSLFGRVLDAGSFFFNEGERMSRLTSWAAAFHEWKALNPSKTVDNAALGRILRRADDMSVNMTRASNASYQSGVWSIPTQFFPYAAHMTELLAGKRLTGVEKLRVLATMSALYGLPIGLGTTIGAVWPAYDSFREYALGNNIPLHEDWIKVATDGLMSYATSLLLGKDYNVAQRYGPNGNQVIKDFLDGDKTIGDLVFGASGTIVGDILKSTAPFYHWAAATITGEDYPLMSTDWTKALRNISTVDEAMKAWGVLQYGVWQSKSGREFKDTDTIDALAVSLGLTPQRFTDTYFLQNILRGQKKAQDGYAQQAREDFRRSLQAAGQGDYKAADAYRSRAQASIEAAKLSLEDQQRLYRSLINSNKDLADTVRWDLFRHSSPENARSVFDTYIKGNQ